MSERLRAALRTVQTRFPGLRDAKFAAYNRLTRHFGLAMDREFRALARLGPVALALDVGGNRGQSIEALRRTARPARIVSFEPQPDLAAALQRAYPASGGVTVEACALGAATSTMRLFIPRYGDYVFDGLATTDMLRALSWLGPHTLLGFDPHKLQADACDVPVRRLDDFGLTPDIVKIDVEGGELAVVEGGRETFARARPATLVERPGADVTALLGACGLDPYHYERGRLRPPVGYAKNTLFLTREQAARISGR